MTSYGTTANIAGLEQDGIRAYLHTSDFSERTGFYPTERFIYDLAQDCYTCPQGQVLRRVSTRKSEQVIVYRANAKICNACPVKPACTNSKSGRHIFRSFFQEYLDRVKSYEATWYYQKAMRKRQVWVEPLFGEAKQWHGLRQFRLRGLMKVNIQGLMTAAGQNIKRLLDPPKWSKRPDPAGAIALQPPLVALRFCRASVAFLP